MIIYYVNLYTCRLKFDENFKIKKYEILKVVGNHLFIVSAVLLATNFFLHVIPESHEAVSAQLHLTLEEIKQVTNILFMGYAFTSVVIAILLKISQVNAQPRIRYPRVIVILVILMGKTSLFALAPFLNSFSRRLIGIMVVGPFGYRFMRDLMKIGKCHLNHWSVDECDVEKVSFHILNPLEE